MVKNVHSESPIILLRISDESFHMHRSFNDFTQAIRAPRRTPERDSASR